MGLTASKSLQPAAVFTPRPRCPQGTPSQWLSTLEEEREADHSSPGQGSFAWGSPPAQPSLRAAQQTKALPRQTSCVPLSLHNCQTRHFWSTLFISPLSLMDIPPSKRVLFVFIPEAHPGTVSSGMAAAPQPCCPHKVWFPDPLTDTAPKSPPGDSLHVQLHLRVCMWGNSSCNRDDIMAPATECLLCEKNSISPEVEYLETKEGQRPI